MEEMRIWWRTKPLRRVFTAAVQHACTRTEYIQVHTYVHTYPSSAINQACTSYLRNATYLVVVSELYTEYPDDFAEKCKCENPIMRNMAFWLYVLTVQYSSSCKWEVLDCTVHGSVFVSTYPSIYQMYGRFPRIGHPRAERRHRQCRGKWKRTMRWWPRLFTSMPPVEIS
jgi:hypothetical protein